MSDQNHLNNNGGRSGFPPNLGGGDQQGMWAAQAMALQAQQKLNQAGHNFNPADSTQLQQNNGGGNPSSAAHQQQANALLAKALEANQRGNRNLQGGGQLQIPSGSGQVGIAGQHALLQALLANNQHQQPNQQQQFPGGAPSFTNGQQNQNNFSLQLPNQQQQHHNPQQQQQNAQSRPNPNIPPAAVAMLANMGQQGANMIKDWQQGNLSGEQMIQLKQLLAAHQARQVKPTNPQQQQQNSHAPTQAQTLQPASITAMNNERLGQVIASLTAKVKNLESSLQTGAIPADAVERAKQAMNEWTLQLRNLVREAQSRNLPLVQNGNAVNIHSSPNPAFNQGNPQINQFNNNAIPPAFTNSPNLQARPNPAASFNQTSTPADPAQQRQTFFSKLTEMYRLKGMKITSPPQVEGRGIDLFDLYMKVAQEGGSENVKARNLWPVVGAHLGLASSTGVDGMPRSSMDTANQVADIFGTYLLSFEDAWKNAHEDRKLVHQSPQLGQQQQTPQQPEINDAVLERLSQMPQAQRETINLPVELSRRLDIYIAQKAANNGSSPQIQPGAIGGQQHNPATFAWARQQQQYAEASARGGNPSGGVPSRTASGGAGQQPGQDAPRPFVPPTSEENASSRLYVTTAIDSILQKLRASPKEIEGLTNEEKNEISQLLQVLAPQIQEAEKRVTLFRLINSSNETTTSCARAIHMIAMWKNASWQASQGRIAMAKADVLNLRVHVSRFIAYVQTTVQAIMQGSRGAQPTEQQRQQQQQQQQQQSSQQQNLQAQQQLQQVALQQQQEQQQSSLPSTLPDPSSFAGRLRPEDLRAPPPPKRARTASLGGIASPSPAATTPAELRTPAADAPSPANGKSPASSKKGTPKEGKQSAAAIKKEKTALNRKSSVSGAGKSTLDQVKEENGKRDRSEDVVEIPSQGVAGGSGGAMDPASVLGLQMDGWEERRRQEEVAAAAKDPVSFFQTQWNNLQQAQLQAANGGVSDTFHDGGAGSNPNGLDHTALARAMRDIRQPSSYGSSSSSYPIASTSTLPYNHHNYPHHAMMQQPPLMPGSPDAPEDDGFDISFFLDASQYEDEEADEETVAPTEDDGGAGTSQGSTGGKVGSSSSSDPRPIDAQTPDLLHSSGPHDESPASVKEAISPPRLLPFRSSTGAIALDSSLPLTNRSASNPFARANPNPPPEPALSTSAESLSVLIPPLSIGDNPLPAKSISPLPLETPSNGENGLSIWGEMGEDSYFGGGSGGFDWEGTPMEGATTNGSGGWLINSS